MAIYWSEKVFLLRRESTYGVAPSLTASDAILATNIRLQPMEGQDTGRGLERPYMGAQETIPTNVHARLTFTAEILPSGEEGTPPALDAALRACACARVVEPDESVSYSPISRAHESAAVHLWIGDTRYALVGARGTAVARWNASGVPVVDFDLMGLFVMPTEATPVVPDLEDQLDADVLVATSANTPVFTIDDVPLVMRSFALNLGNQVEPRFLVRSDSVLITGKSEMIETTVEAVPLTTLNPFALAMSRAKVPVVLQHGTEAGNIVTLSVPRAQMQRQAGLEEQQGLKEWPLRLVPQPTGAGNDQWALTFT